MKLHFTELRVSDWHASLAWYRDVLGLGVLLCDEPGRFALLDAGGARLALKAGEPRPGGTLLAFEVEELATWIERLRDHVRGPVAVSDEGYRRVEVGDPDEYAIVLFEWVATERTRPA